MMESVVCITTHNRQLVASCPPPSQKLKNKKNSKFIDNARQGVFTGVLKGAESKNGLYLVLRPLLHSVFAWFLLEVG